MVMTTGAADREPKEHRTDGAGDLGKLGLALHRRIHVPHTEVARTATAEAGRNQGRMIGGRGFVTGKLQHQKLVVRHTRIQRHDDPIAIPPGVGSIGVTVEAV